MAITVATLGTSSNTVSGVSFTLNITGSNATPDSTVVLALAVDNANTSGTAHSTFTVTDALGNTWVRRASPLYDPGAASAGVEGAVFETKQNAGNILTSTTITVTFGTATTVKAWSCHELVGQAVTFVSSGVNTGAATGTPTVNTAAALTGDAVMGFGFAESGALFTADADTTNGSWTALNRTFGGAGTSGMSIIAQAKVVTAGGAQTYNPTLTSADCILAWAIWREIPTADTYCGGGWW